MSFIGLNQFQQKEGYSLPVNCARINIIQGYNGPFSHKKFEIGTGNCKRVHDDRFSLDFELEIGSEILASKDGEVILASDEITKYYTGLEHEIGLRHMPNLALLKHSENEFTLYSHFMHKGLVVKRGDNVKQGDILGYSGLSGWIGPIPHVHFEALEFVNGFDRRSFPVKFEDYELK